MKRRNFLKQSGFYVGVGTFLKASGMFNGIQMTAMASSPLLNQLNTDNDKIIVLIQLMGGNDGLNTIIPLDVYDNLANLRSNILIPKNKIISLTDKIGLHPALNDLSTLWKKNQLCIVQNVGYPEQNRSHFRSYDIWKSGSPANEEWSTGWLGQYLDKLHTTYPKNYPNQLFPDPLAINIGTSVSDTCQGTHANFGFAMTDTAELSSLDEESMEHTISKEYTKELQFIQTTIHQTNAYSKVILQAIKKGNNLNTYPTENKLAQQLKMVSKLISGGLKTKIYVLTLDGFDNHANQTSPDNTCEGDHATCLTQLSEATKAFQDDLNILKIDKKVIGLCTSEFGRQIQSNNSFGTDHGTAAPLLVFGSNIKETIVGENPKIEAKVELQAGVEMKIDFRDVYSSVLVNWLGLQETDAKNIFQKDISLLPIL